MTRGCRWWKKCDGCGVVCTRETRGPSLIGDGEVATWLNQIAAFGLHTAALDVRQQSAVYREVVWAVLTASTRKLSPLPTGWQRSIEMLGQYSLRVYRELVDHPRFGEF